MERGLATVISAWVAAFLMISYGVGEQTPTEGGNGSMMTLVSTRHMALTWCKHNDSPRSSGYEFFPARRWWI